MPPWLFSILPIPIALVEDGDCDILTLVKNKLRATHEQGGCSDRLSGKKSIVSGFRYAIRNYPAAPKFFSRA
jgi:hypothetical protein